MPKSSEQIKNQISVLKLELARAEAEETTAAKEAYATVKKEWEWRVEWKNEGTVRIEVKQTQATIDKYKELKERFPYYHFSTYSDQTVWNGMTYHITRGDYIVSTGGGVVVLNLKNDWDGGPTKITQEQLEALLKGEVPEELKTQYYQI